MSGKFILNGSKLMSPTVYRGRKENRGQYTVKTNIREHQFNNMDWRDMLGLLKLWGYNPPISVCRKLWKGERFMSFDGVEIENLWHVFSK